MQNYILQESMPTSKHTSEMNIIKYTLFYRFTIYSGDNLPSARMCSELSVCLSVSHMSPLELLFFLKALSRTPRATKVKISLGFSLKPELQGSSSPSLGWPYIRSAVIPGEHVRTLFAEAESDMYRSRLCSLCT